MPAALQKQVDAAQVAKDRTAMEAAMAAATKLQASISAPGSSGADTQIATYGSGENADDIAVTIGANVAVNLSADDNTMIAAHHGWKGAMYTAVPDGGGTYQAVVYSNAEVPTADKRCGGAAENDEYTLTDGALAIDTTQAGVLARVALTGVIWTAGTETFHLPDPNPTSATRGS